MLMKSYQSLHLANSFIHLLEKQKKIRFLKKFSLIFLHSILLALLVLYIFLIHFSKYDQKKTIFCMFVDQKHQKNFRTANTTRSHYDRIFPINRSARLLQYF